MVQAPLVVACLMDIDYRGIKTDKKKNTSLAAGVNTDECNLQLLKLFRN
jgi:hypothetical protein